MKLKCLILFLLINIIYCQDKAIILMGDTQRTSNWEIGTESNTGIARAMFTQVANENPAFLIHLGDLVFNGSSKNCWKEFDQDASELIKSKIPFYPVPGNHEYFGNNTKALENLFSRFPLLSKKTWYSFKYKKLAVILFNSNFDELTGAENLEQLKWFKEQLKSFQEDSTVNFIIAGCHHPPFTNSKVVSPNESVLKFFIPSFLKTAKAKIFFSGHCHSYEHFIKEGKHFIVTGGGGGPRQKLEINPSNRKYNDLYKGEDIRFFNYCKLFVDGGNLRLEIYKMNANGLFTVADYVTIL